MGSREKSNAYNCHSVLGTFDSQVRQQNRKQRLARRHSSDFQTFGDNQQMNKPGWGLSEESRDYSVLDLSQVNLNHFDGARNRKPLAEAITQTLIPDGNLGHHLLLPYLRVELPLWGMRSLGVPAFSSWENLCGPWIDPFFLMLHLRGTRCQSHLGTTSAIPCGRVATDHGQ